MWLWLLIQLAPVRLPPVINHAAAAELENPTSSGPVSAEEARIIWQDGKKAFEDGRYQDAATRLQRLVDRYPGYPGYLEAHRYLGRSLMLLGRARDAEEPLKAYVNATGDRPLGLQARLWLGEDYLLLSKASEAYLTALGVEKATAGNGANGNRDLHAESQLLKTRALMALNQDLRAKRVLDSVELSPAVQSNPVLKGHLARARIELKLRSCSRLPATGRDARRMSDGQAREQFAKRALCLQEALVLFKDAAESGDSQTAQDAARRISEAYFSYASAVRNPPVPPRLKPTDRTAEQKRQYKAELIDRLEQDRKKALLDSLATLSNWRSKAQAMDTSTATAAAASYSKLSTTIGALPGSYQ